MGDGVNPKEILLTTDNIDGTIVDGKNGGRRMKGRLAGGVRDQLTMAEMKARMASLWKDGALYIDIAATVSDEFGLEGSHRFNANSIHYHIKNLKKYWRDIGLLHVDERMSLILARYDQLEMLAMEAYFASCTGRNTTNYEKSIERARSRDREKILREQIQQERERRSEELHGNQKGKPQFEFQFDDGELEDTLVTTHERIKEYSRQEDNLAGDPKWISILVDINDKRAALWGMKNRRGPTNEDQERAKLSDEQRDQRLAAVLNAAIGRREKSKTNLAEMAPLGGWTETDENPNTTTDTIEVPVDTEWEVPKVTIDGDKFEFDFSEDEDADDN